MNNIKKSSKIFLLTTLVITSIVLINIKYITSKISQKIQKRFITILESKTDKKITFDKITCNLNSVKIEKPTIYDKITSKNLFTSKQINLQFDPYYIINTKKTNIDMIEIDNADINLLKIFERWNFDDITEMLGKDQRPFYERYTVKNLILKNSNASVKTKDIELLFQDINANIFHPYNTPIFKIDGNFKLFAVIKDRSIFGKLKINTNIRTTYPYELKGKISIDEMNFEKINITNASVDLKYFKGKKVEVSLDIKDINNYRNHHFWSKIEKKYIQIFSKKFDIDLSKLEISLAIDKDRSELKINSPSFSVLSIIDFLNKTHQFFLHSPKINVKSNSEISHPSIISNLSDTSNEIIIDVIKGIENKIIDIKEAL